MEVCSSTTLINISVLVCHFKMCYPQLWAMNLNMSNKFSITLDSIPEDRHYNITVAMIYDSGQIFESYPFTQSKIMSK